MSGAPDFSHDCRGIGPGILFALLFAFPSLSLFQRHLGLAGVLGYTVAVAIAWWIVRCRPAALDGWIARHFRWLCAAFAIGLFVVFAIGYPLENARGPQNSSDRDNALNLAAGLLVAGESPYYESSNEAGPLSLLPGAVILGTPFAILGNSAFQNIFWIIAFILICARGRDGPAPAFILGIGMMALSPAALHEFVSGGDMLANGLYVPAAMWLATRATPGQKSGIRMIVASVFLGLCLASRPNFCLLLPLYIVALWRLSGFRQALLSGVIAGSTALGLCLAFYLPDPAGFSPLVTGNKLAGIDLHFPWASKSVFACLSAALAFSVFHLWKARSDRTVEALFRCCALVTLLPMLAAVILLSFIRGGPDLGFIHDRYGLMYLGFALLGFGLPWLRRSDRA